jgi:hypothetical protein
MMIMLSVISTRVHLILSFFLLFILSYGSLSSSALKERFMSKFAAQCSSFPFVQRYQQLMEQPNHRYTIFVFHETGKSVGGLGDRFAGIITALAYSIRFSRRLIVAADNSFYDYFEPFYGSNTSYVDWKSCETSDLQVIHCINPKPHREHSCGFYQDSAAKVVKIYSNRCYLCRWLFKSELNLAESLKLSLGIDIESDLFSVAGCMMQLAMKPTEKLWHDLHSFLLSSSTVAMTSSGQPIIDFTTLKHQVGIHFRCGDSSLVANKDSKPNPQCVYSDESSWHGTSFADDKTMDSPIDLGTCANKVLSNLPQNQLSTEVVVYLASDNAMSAQQINSSVSWPKTIMPNGACHVDMGASACTSLTLLHWFALSLSETIITQALVAEVSGSIYHDPQVGTVDNPLERGPISAFSRYAAIYGLSMHRVRFGRGCLTINATRLSHQTSGNWVCTPRKFF